jgi:hypothetical protein
MLNLMPKASREILPTASRPTRSLPHGSTSVPPSSASSSTSFVTPLIVRLPMIFSESSSIASIDVDSKVISG